jgi:hypothetical protein
MKCQQCSTDAPAETDPQSGRLRCPQCHAFFGTGTNKTADVRHARDILKKWSSADLLDQISSFPQVPPLSEATRMEQQQSVEEPNEPAESQVLSLDEDSSEDPQTTEPDAEVSGSDESVVGAPSFLSLVAALPEAPVKDELESVGPSPEFAKEEDIEVAPAEVPALSIMKPDNSVQPSDSQDDETTTELAEAESAGLAASAELERTKKTKRRHLARPPQKRRMVRPVIPAATVFGQRSGTPEEEMGAMKKNFRIDRPVDPSEADELVDSTDASTTTDPRAQVAPAVRRYRIDTAEDVQDLSEGGGRVRGQSRPRQRFIDEAHDTTEMRGPHFSVAAPKRSSLTSLTGQFLAYIGVLGLTIGTAIVIYGHFGGYSEYTPTGWLVTTVAQMLLFLGVINLVSGGIEQNNHDVSHRINVLGEQLMRIEQVTESAMRGPKIPVERYAGTASADEVSEREMASVEDKR